MMKKIQRYIILLIGGLGIAISLFLLREHVLGIESWHIEVTFFFIELGLLLTGIIAAIYGYVRWRKLPSIELAQWHRQFKGRKEMARCPRCGSLKIKFEQSSPVPCKCRRETKDYNNTTTILQQ